MASLWLAQLLCPSRHAICGLAYDVEETPKEEIEEKLQRILAERVGGIDPWCGLCGSKELHIEHGKLRSDNWEEVLPVLEALQAANLRTREAFHRSKGSVN